MKVLLTEIRRNRLLWLLAFVPVLVVADVTAPQSHALLFILSILAIVPLAGLLSTRRSRWLRRLETRLAAF